MIQLIIAITGLTALALTQFPVPDHWRKFAPVFGLIGQPFWIMSTYNSPEWGIFILCCCYLVVWIIGFYRAWIAKDFYGFRELNRQLNIN